MVGKSIILLSLLGYFLLEIGECITSYTSEFAKYGSSSVSSSSQLNCHALAACADVDSVKCTSSSLGLQCSGARSCQESTSMTASAHIRANGYMAVAGSDSVKSSSDFVDCWGEV